MSKEIVITELFPWITSSFVQNAIEKSENTTNVVLKSYTAKKCFNDGENFSSYMIGLNVLFEDENHEEKQRDFILKIAIQTEEFQRICEECLLFDREIEAYTRVLPVVVKSLEDVGISAQIAPK